MLLGSAVLALDAPPLQAQEVPAPQPAEPAQGAQGAQQQEGSSTSAGSIVTGTSHVGTAADAPNDPTAEPAHIPPPAAVSVDKTDRVPLLWSAGLMWDTGYGSAGVVRSTGQTFNPTFVWDFLAYAGVNFDRDTSLTLVQPLTVELTDSESTNRRQQVLFDDLGVDLSHTFLRAKPADGQALKVIGSGRVMLPISLASKAATTIVGTRARVQARYQFEEVMHGLLTRLDFRYTRRWNKSSTGVVDAQYSCTLIADDYSRNCAHLEGSGLRDSFLLGAGVDLTPVEKWTVSLDASFGWGLAHDLGNAAVPISSGSFVDVSDTSTTHWRNTRLFTLSVGYDFATWFSLYGLVTNSFSERSLNGELRAPGRLQDTALGLRVLLSFDELYLSANPDAGN